MFVRTRVRVQHFQLIEHAMYCAGVHFVEIRPFARLVSSGFSHVSETIVPQKPVIAARHRRLLTFALIIAVIPAVPSRRQRLSVIVGIGLSRVVIDTRVTPLPVVFRSTARVTRILLRSGFAARRLVAVVTAAAATTVTAEVLSVHAELAIVIVVSATVSVPPTVVVAAAAGRVSRIISVHRRRRSVARSRVVALFSDIEKLPMASRVVCRPALKVVDLTDGEQNGYQQRHDSRCTAASCAVQQ